MSYFSTHCPPRFISIVLIVIQWKFIEIVSEKCGITARDLFNQPNFSTVLVNFIQWVDTCVDEAQQSGVSYYPGSFHITRVNLTSHTVLVAHNGFPFDFIFLVAEVKRRKLEDIFNGTILYFADTLYDAKRVSCNLHV